jgi:hypothetical protein
MTVWLAIVRRLCRSSGSRAVACGSELNECCEWASEEISRGWLRRKETATQQRRAHGKVDVRTYRRTGRVNDNADSRAGGDAAGTARLLEDLLVRQVNDLGLKLFASLPLLAAGAAAARPGRRGLAPVRIPVGALAPATALGLRLLLLLGRRHVTLTDGLLDALLGPLLDAAETHLLRPELYVDRGDDALAFLAETGAGRPAELRQHARAKRALELVERLDVLARQIRRGGGRRWWGGG